MKIQNKAAGDVMVLHLSGKIMGGPDHDKFHGEIKTLIANHHGRIKYPETEPETEEIDETPPAPSEDVDIPSEESIADEVDDADEVDEADKNTNTDTKTGADEP